jgi:hypothetical protein
MLTSMNIHVLGFGAAPAATDNVTLAEGCAR